MKLESKLSQLSFELKEREGQCKEVSLVQSFQNIFFSSLQNVGNFWLAGSECGKLVVIKENSLFQRNKDSDGYGEEED